MRCRRESPLASPVRSPTVERGAGGRSQIGSSVPGGKTSGPQVKGRARGAGNSGFDQFGQRRLDSRSVACRRSDVIPHMSFPSSGWAGVAGGARRPCAGPGPGHRGHRRRLPRGGCPGRGGLFRRGRDARTRYRWRPVDPGHPHMWDGDRDGDRRQQGAGLPGRAGARRLFGRARPESNDAQIVVLGPGRSASSWRRPWSRRSSSRSSPVAARPGRWQAQGHRWHPGGQPVPVCEPPAPLSAPSPVREGSALGYALRNPVRTTHLW